MKKRKSKSSIIIKILILIITSIIVFYALYEVINLLKNPTDIVTVENGKIFSETAAEGFIIREETVLKGENYKNGISQIKAEGEKVASGENVFRYYTKDEETLKNKIKDLDNEIAEAQTNENEIFSSDLKVIENEIETKINEMYKMNDVQQIAESKSDIEELVKKKTKIIGELSPSNSHLKSLIKKRSEYESKLNSGSEYMKSQSAGIMSYKVDDLENVLSANSLDNINIETLENINVRTGEIISANNECGKIVNNYYCYIATIINKEKLQDLKEGKTIKIRLQNGEEISADIEKIKQESKDKNLLILKITKNVENLVEYRKINFDIIYWSYSGLKVPNSSIIEENGLNYVVRIRAGYKDKILVKISKQNENYSIVENYTTEELKELGWNTEQIVNNKSISLYDEIAVQGNKNLN